MTGVVMLVMLSVFEMPESDEVARFGEEGVAMMAAAVVLVTLLPAKACV